MKSPARWPGHFNWNLDTSNRKPFIVPRARETMSDGLPRLLPDDPKNLLSVEARKRIQRAIIESDKFVWKAEVLIKKLHLDERKDRDLRKAQLLRNEANFNKAKAIISAHRHEFSKLDIPERRYREIIREEIESASNSMELYDVQRRLLETEFFFPEGQVASLPAPELKPITIPKPETIGQQINRLREECRLSVEELAEEVQLETRSVQRHIADVHIPHNRHLRAYERTFSKLLNRQVVISKTS
jgi:hypothetical protein